MYFLKLLLIGMFLFGVVWLFLNKMTGCWKTFKLAVERCRERTIYYILFLGMIITQAGLIFLRKFPVSADEVYTISNTAFFAGFDVSNYMHMKKFYNFGYSIFFVPLYKLFDNPVVIFRLMLLGNLIIHAFIVLLIYHVVRKKMQCSKCIGIAFSLVSGCNLLMMFFRGYMYNEIPLSLVNWAAVLLLLELVDAGKKNRIIVSLFLGMLMAYAYVIHSRCIILYLAIAIIVGLYLIVYKKLLVQPLFFAAGFVPLYCLEQKMLQYVQKYMYLKEEGAEMVNSVSQVASGTSRFALLTSISGIGKLIAHLFSLAGTLSVQTGGLLTILTVAVLYYLFKNRQNIYKGLMDKKKFVLLTYAFVSFWGMVMAIALVGAAGGKIRFYAYTRYFVPFIGPFLLAGLLILKYNTQIKFKWVTIWSVMITLGVGLVYVFYSYPAIKKVTMREITSFYLFIPFARYWNQFKFDKKFLVIMLGVLVIFTLGLLFLYRRKQIIALSAAVMIFSVAMFSTVEKKQMTKASGRRYMQSDAIYALCKNSTLLEDKRVQCAGGGNFGRAVFFALYDENIIYDKKQFVFDEDSVILTEKLNTQFQYSAKYVFKLDNNEYIGVWDDELAGKLEDIYEPCMLIEENQQL